MKQSLWIIGILVSIQSPAQQTYWQQQLYYTINAELNTNENSITAVETIVYKNNSPSTLNFIWFHVWPNAYKDESTALLQQIKNDTERSKKMENFGSGFINNLSFNVDGQAAKTEPHSNPQYIDIIKLVLNKPLLPGDSITITTPFYVKLPPYFSRSGYADGEFMACQWYPKPAVFDKNGWHEFPYLDMGEFYSEYADYSVNITIPSEYIVSATGMLQTKEELDAYKKTGVENNVDRKGKPTLYTPSGTNLKKTLRYYAEQVPDFAWFADKDFVIQYDTVQLPGHKMVEGPKNNSSGGMEYPMVTLITSSGAEKESLDAVIAHEIGHNWFMSMLGSNEREHTWMDEGVNTYFQFRYEAQKYRSNSIFGKAIPENIKKLDLDEFLNAIYMVIEKNIPMKSPMDIPADKFPSSEEYGLVSYVKSALWLYLLESSIGWEKMQLAFHNYFNKWKNKHPQPEDMKAAFEEAIGSNLDKFFSLIKVEGKLE